MKFIKKETTKGSIILTFEESFFFGLVKNTVKFIVTEEYPKGYWYWSKLPNRTLISTRLSFQLDKWCTGFE